jgi:enoyl-CoA hydratase
MEFKYTLFKVEEGIAYITFNKPEQLNVMCPVMLDEFKARITECECNDDIKAVILTGSGKAFIAGADIKFMRELSLIPGRQYLLDGQEAMHRLERMPKPVIAAVNGHAFGGGLETALSCDFRIFSSKAKLGLPEVKLGIFPGWGGTQRLSRAANIGVSKYLIFTGKTIGADEAFRYGIAQEVVEPEQVLPRARELALEIMQNAPIAVGMVKRAITVGANCDLHSAIDFEAEAYVSCFASEDRVEGMSAFVEKRPPAFKGK